MSGRKERETREKSFPRGGGSDHSLARNRRHKSRKVLCTSKTCTTPHLRPIPRSSLYPAFFSSLSQRASNCIDWNRASQTSFQKITSPLACFRYKLVLPRALYNNAVSRGCSTQFLFVFSPVVERYGTDCQLRVAGLFAELTKLVELFRRGGDPFLSLFSHSLGTSNLNHRHLPWTPSPSPSLPSTSPPLHSPNHSVNSSKPATKPPSLSSLHSSLPNSPSQHQVLKHL